MSAFFIGRFPGFSQKPQHYSQSDDGDRQGNQGGWLNFIQIENDHFPRQSHQGDHDNGSDLDDAFLARRHLDDGMLEFHRNEHRHNHPENRLESAVFQGIQPT